MCVCVSSFVHWIYRHQGLYILETFEKTFLCASLVMLYLQCFWFEICVLYSQGSIFDFDLSLRKWFVALRKRVPTIHRILPQKSPCADVG